MLPLSKFGLEAKSGDAGGVPASKHSDVGATEVAEDGSGDRVVQNWLNKRLKQDRCLTSYVCVGEAAAEPVPVS